MSFPLSSLNHSRIGKCPHGLPAGACPICSGMGGGGGASTRKADKPSGEMSWDECYAVWQQMLRAKEAAQLKRNEALQAQMQPPVSFTAKMDNVAQKFADFAQRLTTFIQKNSVQHHTLPAIFSKPLVLAAKIALPIVNVLKNIPVLAQNTAIFIKEKLADISDKLSAMFGELRNSKEKKVSDRLKDFKKKIKSLFSVFEAQETEENLEDIYSSPITYLKNDYESFQFSPLNSHLLEKELPHGNG